MKTLPDNIVWDTLCGPHAQYSAGTHEARRYLAGFTPFIAFADLAAPNFQALAPYIDPGERVYCDGWAGAAPAGWRVDAESVLVRMRWEGEAPVAEQVRDAVLLGPQHAGAAFELATLTRPGPFAPRAIELGEYFGVFDGTTLVAMAGGRNCAGGFTEITGVCTHPDFQGKGLAKGLVLKLIRRRAQLGGALFLRVMRENRAIHGFYERMGFRDYRETVAREVSRY